MKPASVHFHADAAATTHCPDGGVRLLWQAALPLCLAPRLAREMWPVPAGGGQAGMRRDFHNMRSAKIAVITSKPAEFKAKLEVYLTIENRQAHLLHALACTDQQMPVVNTL